MTAVNPVGTWAAPLFGSQTGTAYKTNLDNCIAVAERIARAFAPHAKTTPDMNVLIDHGAVFSDNALVEKAQQTIGPITAPVSNPRIDRIVVDVATGVASRIAGTEAASPVAPAIPDDTMPICQIALTVGMSSITNANISDERLGGGVAGGVKVVDRVTTDVTVGNTGAETDVFRKSVTNILGTNKMLRLTIFFRMRQHADDSGTINIRFKYGATTVCATGAVNISTASNTHYILQWLLFADGATNAQTGRVIEPSGGNTFVPAGAPLIGSATEDSTVAKDVAVTADWDAANGANQDCTMLYAILERI